MIPKPSFFLLIALGVVPIVSIPLVYASNHPQSFQSAQLSEDTITEKAIEQMITGIGQAITDKNVTGLLNYFAPFIYSEVTFNTDITSETLKITGLAEHEAYFTEQWKNIASTEELFNDYQISLSSDEQSAIIRRVRLLNVTLVDGRKLIVSSEAEARIAKVEGELKIITLKEVADVGIRPQ